MSDPSDVVVGLEVDVDEIRTAGFDLGGRALAVVRRPLLLTGSEEGGVELDPARLWYTVMRTIRQLADQIPDLGRRTVAIGLTGALGGVCLIDEDGDPLPPLISPLDRRRHDGRRTPPGDPLADRLLDARLGWLAAQPDLLERAASAVTVKDWVFFCLTGVSAAEEIETGLTFGDDSEAALTRCGLGAHTALPAAPLASGDPRPLGAAASAITGFWEETPVVLAPPAPLSAALALGAAGLPDGRAISFLGREIWHGVITQASGGPVALALPTERGIVRLTLGRVGADAVAWLGGQLDALLGEVGLIGQSAAELHRVLDDRAGAAPPGRVRFCPTAGTASCWSFAGLDPGTGLADLLRSVYEAIGRAAREAYAHDGHRLNAIAVAGDLASSDLLRRILAASVGLPLRRLVREAPAATGAAMAAAMATGEITDLAAAGGSWVEPHLGPAEAPDPALVEAYASGPAETIEAA